MLRIPRNVSPDDHPACVVFIKGSTFEDFLLNADDLCKNDDHRSMLWQNPNAEAVGKTAIPKCSSMFDIVRRKTHVFFGEKEKTHFDGKIKPSYHDPALMFEGRSLRVSEQLRGNSGTSFYHVDPANAKFSEIAETLSSGRSSLSLTPNSPYYDALEGPFTLRPGQAPLIFSRAFGDIATLHGFALKHHMLDERETLLTDIAPITLRV